MEKKKKYMALAASFGITAAAGGLSYLLTGKTAMEGYQKLHQPPLAPPGWIFPVVWSILYALMAISSWRVWLTGKREALRLYFTQLALNVVWTPVFFRLKLFWGAFAILLVLEAAILAMIAGFRKVDRPAALLQVPYAIWVAFAGYLNAAIAWLN